MPSTADYITLSVHLCLTGGAPPPAMKSQSTGTISYEADSHHNLMTADFSQPCCSRDQLTSNKTTLARNVAFAFVLKWCQSQNVCSDAFVLDL